MARRRVQLWDIAFKNRFVKIEENATEGATLGKDIFWPNGEIVTPEALKEYLAGLPDSEPNPENPFNLVSTLWRLILEIPSRVKDIENMVKPGYVYHDGTSMVPHEWPAHDTRVESDEDVVIGSNKQYLIWRSVAIEGTVSIGQGAILVILDEGLPAARGPDMSYDGSGNLTQIVFDGGQQKDLSYDASGDLIRVDYTEDGVTLRKDLVYSGGDLDYINEYYI